MYIRIPVTLIAASAITFFLFLGMQFLIAISDAPKDETVEFRIIDTRIPPVETEPESTRTKPEKPVEPAVQPEPPTIDIINPKPGGEVGPRIIIEPKPGPGIVDINLVNRDILPIVRVEPRYPERALQKGVEGFVQLEFTVLSSGEVDANSIQIIHTEPSSIFNSAAKRAVLKWKYQPKIVDGKAVTQHGVRTLLSFALEE